ncbi:hypothetical protein [Butyrivibrio sp. MC2021]|uniref:hypothetical protein n=1 Tax=Butyrivibrio sp. MC2021 TaxID=1408306 RepID=UPI0012DE34FE|nr:hypothetical protein [Butyrivibrio sp. MC2021]
MKNSWIVQSINNKKADRIPYWGELFGLSAVDELLENEDFHLYRFQNGEYAKSVLISDSEKWLCLALRYYPLDLIAFYSATDDFFAFIDGRRIRVSYGSDEENERLALKELFGPYAYREGRHTYFYPDKNHRTGKPPVWLYDQECVLAFEKLGYESPFNDKYHNVLVSLEYDYSQKDSEYGPWKKVYEEYEKAMKKLLTADWRQLRYDWEVAMLDVEFKAYDPERQLRIELNNLSRPDNAFKALNSMVLDDESVKLIAAAVRKGQIDNFDRIFDLKAYTDPFYVCNCIRMLEMLEQPRNMMGIPFLFDCLGDITEPYYDMATDLLVTFHDDVLISVLESQFKSAIEAEDVLKVAGLMAFSERIHYKLVG